MYLSREGNKTVFIAKHIHLWPRFDTVIESILSENRE